MLLLFITNDLPIMKKNYLLIVSFFLNNKKIALFALVLLQSIGAYSQNLKPFTPRFDKSLKGDILLIGNNILNAQKDAVWWPSYQAAIDPNSAYDGNGFNSNFTMKYIDVDSDNSTFSSSSANLKISNPDCYKIVYAGLYWSAILQQTDRKGIENVKLKLPNATSYVDIAGKIIFDTKNDPIGDDKNKAYACYADITNLVSNLTDAQGTYTVANVISSEGKNGGTGLSAGWSIFVVYEDPTLPAKYITTFDGFTGIDGKTSLDIDVSGFKTIPTGPVKIKFAFSALEGDQAIDGDYLEINGTKISATNAANNVIRNNNNFFNSSITYIDPATGKTADFLDRKPNSKNTLGFDAGVLNIDNPEKPGSPGGVIIGNNATSAKIKLGTTQDVYFYYFNAFAIDIIEPKIVLTKTVENTKGDPIGNTNVKPKDILTYVIGFQNKGNDNATSFTIKDQLPVNTAFNYPSGFTLPNGVTVNSVVKYDPVTGNQISGYNPVTRTIVFDIDKNLVEIGDGESKIRITVTVSDCDKLSDVCSNIIVNQAFATYKGDKNTSFLLSEDPSVNTYTGCLVTPNATNFLVGVDNCKFTKSEVLCGTSVLLTAANGYSTYSWSTSPTGSPVIGTGQTYTATKAGTYYVHNTAIAPCLSIDETITVTSYSSIINNPVIPYSDVAMSNSTVCPNDGKFLPKIFLCGAKASRSIKTNISDGSTIVWEKLKEGSCVVMANDKCANENEACVWESAGPNGPDFLADTAGQYRITLKYPPGDCFNRFYFNVYKNDLDPTETHTDIICNTKGNITVNGVGTGYEYSISNVNGTTPTNYVATNSFPISTAGLYTVFVRQIGVSTNPCIFSIPNIQIRQRDFKVTTSVTQPLCYGEKGKIKVIANDGNPQYTYYVYDAGTLVNSAGPIPESDYTFDNLTPGKTYQVRVTTPDNCDKSEYIYINQPASPIIATAVLAIPLTSCSDGKIVMSAKEGNWGPYSYFVNGSSTFEPSNEIIVKDPGKYDILVVDAKNCSTTTSITVDKLLKPTYTVTPSTTAINCYGDNAKINIALNGSAAGYKVEYSIDNGLTYKEGTSTGAEFVNVYPGTYNVLVRFTVSYKNSWGGTETIICPIDPGYCATAQYPGFS